MLIRHFLLLWFVSGLEVGEVVRQVIIKQAVLHFLLLVVLVVLVL
jgi:hypothetical protein